MQRLCKLDVHKCGGMPKLLTRGLGNEEDGIGSRVSMQELHLFPTWGMVPGVFLELKHSFCDFYKHLEQQRKISHNISTR